MRFAAYCRVSTEHEEQLSSMKNQKEFFLEYAQKTGDILTEVYADEGISGRDMKKRGEFLRMIEDAGKGNFDYVAVKDISRFARNTGDFLYGIRTLKRYGVDVRFLANNQTVIGESEFALTIFAALAQQESENTSLRVSFGKRRSAGKGSVPNCVYGYDKTNAFTLVINDNEAETVRKIFSMYINGRGLRAVAQRLNESGISSKRSGMWYPKTVKRILQNSIYIGRMTNNKSETKDFITSSRKALPKKDWFIHEREELRIISDEDFYKAQEIINGRKAVYGSDTRFSSLHLFSNVIVCGECGKKFSARKGRNAKVRYRCSSHKNGGNICCANAVTVSEEVLYLAVKEYIKVQQRTADIQEKKQILSRMEKIQKRRKKFCEMYAAEVISIDELKNETAKADRETERLKSELEKCSQTEKTQTAQVINADVRGSISKIVIYEDRRADVFLKEDCNSISVVI